MTDVMSLMDAARSGQIRGEDNGMYEQGRGQTFG